MQRVLLRHDLSHVGRQPGAPYCCAGLLRCVCGMIAADGKVAEGGGISDCTQALCPKKIDQDSDR